MPNVLVDLSLTLFLGSLSGRITTSSDLPPAAAATWLAVTAAAAATAAFSPPATAAAAAANARGFLAAVPGAGFVPALGFDCTAAAAAPPDGGLLVPASAIPDLCYTRICLVTS